MIQLNPTLKLLTSSGDIFYTVHIRLYNYNAKPIKALFDLAFYACINQHVS